MDNIPPSLSVGTAPAATNEATPIQAPPGAGTFREWRVQQAEGACAPLQAAVLPGVHGAGPVPYRAASRIGRVPAGTVTRAPVASRSWTHVLAESQAEIPTPVALHPAIDGFGPDTKPPVASGAGEPCPPGARIELNEELGRVLRNGYAKGIIDEGDTARVHPDADVAFRNIVVSFNRTMEDLLHRFPGLRNVEPPLLCRNDAHQAPGGTELPYYQPDRAAISFPIRDGPRLWVRKCAYEDIQSRARATAIPDIILHQYGHHLSSGQIVPAALWGPHLSDVALANSRLWLVLKESILKPADRSHFPSRVVGLCLVFCEQALPDRLLSELAAETIAWRLHPAYGQSGEAPIMPWCLENWVRECFPFLATPEGSERTDDAVGNRLDTGRSACASGLADGRHDRAALNPPSTSSSGLAQESHTPTGPPETLQFANLVADRIVRDDAASMDHYTRRFLEGNGSVLATEVLRALGNRYAKGFLLTGDAFSPNPHTNADFTRIVREYNKVMANVHERFPALGDTEPPYLSSNNVATSERANRDDCNRSHARYNVLFHYLEFVHLTDFSKWERLIFNDGCRSHAPTKGFFGLVAHEYGHHLSSDAVVSRSVWLPGLKAMLEAIPRESEAGLPESMHISFHQAFRARYGMLIGTMGIGHAAGESASEFAAEAIAWRLHPDYGGKPCAPRMPRYLENWVHECFPFLDNGQIPVPCKEVNPDLLMTFVKWDGRSVWMPRRANWAMPTLPVPETNSGPAAAASHVDNLSPRQVRLESGH